MDLKRLKIDRMARSVPAARRRFPWGAVVLVGVIGAAALLFHAPVMRWVDRVRLPEVRILIVRKAHAAAVGAVQGKAANGYIVASRRAALSADRPGRIVELNVEEGTRVKEGDVVARIYSEEFEAAQRRAVAEVAVAEALVKQAETQVEAAEAEVKRLEEEAAAAAKDAETAAHDREFAGRDLKRFEELFEQDLVTRQVLDEARTHKERAVSSFEAEERRATATLQAVEWARLRSDESTAARKVAEERGVAARAARDEAQANLDKTFVRAPFDGIVVLKDAEVGEVVSPDSQGGSNARGSVCTMVDFDSLEVQADVPETSLQAVKLGAPVQIFLDAYPDRTYRGQVSRIWPTANRQKATVEVRVKFHEPDESLRPEMGVRVVFTDQPALVAESGEPPALLIPREAVVRIEGQDGVFVVERDRVSFRVVSVGDEKGGRVPVESGLSEGERIVADPPSTLESGDRVRVLEG